MIRALIALTLILAPHATQAAGCHAALVLALDLSDSVDEYEADLQRKGLANALRDDAVRAAIMPRAGLGAALMVFEWNNPEAEFEVQLYSS